MSDEVRRLSSTMDEDTYCCDVGRWQITYALQMPGTAEDAARRRRLAEQAHAQQCLVHRTVTHGL